MDQLIQEFEAPIVDESGSMYRVFLYGRSRPADTWQGWLVFERVADGVRFSTDVETTQPSAQTILYWATGLTDTYFDGALARALRPHPHNATAIATPDPVTGGNADVRRRRLGALERAILNCFGRHSTTRLLTRNLFDELRYAHADIVRALEDLEKQGGLVVRATEEGNDWVSLTGAGMEEVGLFTTPSAEERHQAGG